MFFDSVTFLSNDLSDWHTALAGVMTVAGGHSDGGASNSRAVSIFDAALTWAAARFSAVQVEPMALVALIAFLALLAGVKLALARRVKTSGRYNKLTDVTELAASAPKTFWQYPLPTGSVADRYISGPLADGSGDQDALIEIDPKVTPWAPPYVMKQLPVTVAGTVRGQMQTYPFPRVLSWLSLNSVNNMDLGGTVTVFIGEEMEQHTFDAPTLLYIPANVPHGVAVYGKNLRLPIMYVDTFPDGERGEPVDRPDLTSRLPDLSVKFPDKSENPPGGETWNPAGGGVYGQYFFSGCKPDPVSPLPASQIRLFPGDIPGLPMEKGFLFICHMEEDILNGVPLHITHSHPCNENLIYFSTDPEKPHDLGASVTIYAFDTEVKKLVPVEMTKPFVSSSARGKHLHCPMIRNNMTRPLGFIWYARDYDPRVFSMGPMGSVATQLHNEHYTNGRFSMSEYGVPDEHLPDDHQGDGGFMQNIEPHMNWTIAQGHNGVYAPALKIRPKPWTPIVDSLSEPLQSPGNIDGIWDCETVTMMGPMPIVMNLRAEGNILTGEVGIGPGPTAPVINGQISGNDLIFRCDLKGPPGGPPEMGMRARLHLEGDTLSGTFGLTGLPKGPCNGTRRK